LKENSCVERNEKQINYLRSIIIRMLIICPEENPTEIVLSFFQKKNYLFLFDNKLKKNAMSQCFAESWFLMCK
jgi:hypothetical protein